MCLVSERMKWDLQEALPTLASLRERLLISLDVAKALQYLHKEGMMHRDVKSQNVLVRKVNCNAFTAVLNYYYYYFFLPSRKRLLKMNSFKFLHNCEDLFHFCSLSAVHSYDLYHIHFTPELTK